MLVAFHNALVALATDANLRGRFAVDARALEGYGLDPSAERALVALPKDLLERYAQSLLAKRWSEVARVVPLTRRVSPSLSTRYQTYLSTHPAPAHDTALSPGLAEALRVMAELRRALFRDAAEARYAGDLLAYEVQRAHARAGVAPEHFCSAFPLHEIVADLDRALIPIDPERGAYEFVFHKRGVQWRRL